MKFTSMAKDEEKEPVDGTQFDLKHYLFQIVGIFTSHLQEIRQLPSLIDCQLAPRFRLSGLPGS